MTTTLPPAGFTQVTVGGSVYNIPNTGTSPIWSSELNAYLIALGNQITGVAGTFDINNRLAIYSSAPTSLTPVPNVVVDPTVLNGAIIQYSARITTSSVTSTEVGMAIATYNSNNPASSKFDLAPFHSCSAGIQLYITDLGQVQVSAPSAAGTGYSMRLRINMKAFEL